MHTLAGLTGELGQLASAALYSLEEAKHMLGNQGCHLVIRQYNMTKRFACRARLAQEQGNDLSTLESAVVTRRIGRNPSCLSSMWLMMSSDKIRSSVPIIDGTLDGHYTAADKYAAISIGDIKFTKR